MEASTQRQWAGEPERGAIWRSFSKPFTHKLAFSSGMRSSRTRVIPPQSLYVMSNVVLWNPSISALMRRALSASSVTFRLRPLSLVCRLCRFSPLVAVGRDNPLLAPGGASADAPSSIEANMVARRRDFRSQPPESSRGKWNDSACIKPPIGGLVLVTSTALLTVQGCTSASLAIVRPPGDCGGADADVVRERT
eukprot:6244477-Prymnesium_polylepis.1